MRYGSALNTLPRLVGFYVRTARPATPMEKRAYGEDIGPQGGAGLVTEVGKIIVLTVSRTLPDSSVEVEMNAGRWLHTDDGTAWFITEDTDIRVMDPPPARPLVEKPQSPTESCSR
jgi:hypothetical protein